MGLFVVTEHIRNMAYHLNLSQQAALRGVYDMFHVLLLCGWISNGVHADVPPTKTDGKPEHEIAEIKGYHERQGEIFDLVCWF